MVSQIEQLQARIKKEQAKLNSPRGLSRGRRSQSQNQIRIDSKLLRALQKSAAAKLKAVEVRQQAEIMPPDDIEPIIAEDIRPAEVEPDKPEDFKPDIVSPGPMVVEFADIKIQPDLERTPTEEKRNNIIPLVILGALFLG